MASSNQELEVKFYLESLDDIQNILVSSGAVLVQPRTYERNLRFDSADHKLLHHKQVLRLRRDHANLLTYKGPSEAIHGVSSREEIELTVGSFENARAFLAALGFQVIMIYEKYRAVYDLDGTLVTLDEMPFGFFVEIEGANGAAIRAACSHLELNWDLRTLESYAVLFETVKQNLNLTYRDLTFENFSETRVLASHLGMEPAAKK